MSDSYENASVLITGASRGIGRKIAIAFARETNRPLVLISRSIEDLNQTRDLCKEGGQERVETISCDLTNPESVENIELPADLPTLGILINNAGSFLLKPLDKTSLQEFSHQIQDNLFSAVNIINRFLPDVKALNRGLIINICSSGALEGLADSGAYASSKHALLGYSRSLRQELMETNIGVTALNLGQTQSTSWEGSSIAPERLIDPNDVAELLVSLSTLSPRSVVEEIIMKPQHGRVPPM